MLFGALCVTLQVFLQYSRYVLVLKWFPFALFAYFGTVLVVKVPWAEALRGLIIPTFSKDLAFWTTVVAIFGTTISPYLFFWQASQEVEDLEEVPTRKPLLEAPKQGPGAHERITVDTYIGMAFSNVVALAIMVTTAATLHVSGNVDIQTSRQAAEALKPVAGEFAFAIFTLGIVGTGLLAVPVLAGSAAYALGEARKWPIGLAREPLEAKAFYLTIALSTFAGVAINFSPLDPMRALFLSAVINGVVAVPVMVMMMLITSNKAIMGAFIITGSRRVIGWLATAVMAAAAAAMVATAIL
jgi:Mn2+/Fe2+ NRAMP family transporter